MFYSFLRELLFFLPAEDAHYLSMNLLRKSCNINFIQSFIQKKFQFNNYALSKKLFGLEFKNPVGLGAGFDKNAIYLDELQMLGFGFVEIGTVTPIAQSGNKKPRLFRLPKDKALINRMGFNNDGVEVISSRLKRYKSEIRNPKSEIIIGGNIGKNKSTPNEDAWKDYAICFKNLFDCVDYFVVNVSSPNTPGLRELQEKESLRKILSNLQNINQQKNSVKPLLLKVSPDVTQQQLNDIISLALEINLDGFVATNTTINRENLSKNSKVKIQKIGDGGLSGNPLKERSTEIIKYISKQTQNKIPIIASGGIFTGEDAKEKLNAGASLVEIWTGFIYEGPSIIKNICNYLLQFEPVTKNLKK
ncbi:MAG: quinone-dependent dihydroorotate dehydrogenase [Chitinophagaceae bacterium]